MTNPYADWWVNFIKSYKGIVELYTIAVNTGNTDQDFPEFIEELRRDWFKEMGHSTA